MLLLTGTRSSLGSKYGHVGKGGTTHMSSCKTWSTACQISKSNTWRSSATTGLVCIHHPRIHWSQRCYDSSRKIDFPDMEWYEISWKINFSSLCANRTSTWWVTLCFYSVTECWSGFVFFQTSVTYPTTQKCKKKIFETKQVKVWLTGRQKCEETANNTSVCRIKTLNLQ